MAKYDVLVLNSTYETLEKILLHKVETSQTNTGAITFRDDIFKAIKNLDLFPLSGKKINKYHAKVISGHLLVYTVDIKNKKVFVRYVVDPKQNTVTSNLFSVN